MTSSAQRDAPSAMPARQRRGGRNALGRRGQGGELPGRGVAGRGGARRHPCLVSVAAASLATREHETTHAEVGRQQPRVGQMPMRRASLGVARAVPSSFVCFFDASWESRAETRVFCGTCFGRATARRISKTDRVATPLYLGNLRRRALPCPDTQSPKKSNPLQVSGVTLAVSRVVSRLASPRVSVRGLRAPRGPRKEGRSKI